MTSQFPATATAAAPGAVDTKYPTTSGAAPDTKAIGDPDEFVRKATGVPTASAAGFDQWVQTATKGRFTAKSIPVTERETGLARYTAWLKQQAAGGGTNNSTTDSSGAAGGSEKQHASTGTGAGPLTQSTLSHQKSSIPSLTTPGASRSGQRAHWAEQLVRSTHLEAASGNNKQLQKWRDTYGGASAGAPAVASGASLRAVDDMGDVRGLGRGVKRVTLADDEVASDPGDDHSYDGSESDDGSDGSDGEDSAAEAEADAMAEAEWRDMLAKVAVIVGSLAELHGKCDALAQTVKAIASQMNSRM